MHRSASLPRFLGLSFLLGLLMATPASGRAEGPRPPGVSAAAAETLAEVEALALTVPNPDSARAILRRLTEEPHEAGTVAGYETAVYVRDRLREWGWEAEFAEYEVLLNEPDGLTSVTILHPDRVELKVIEDPNPLDKDSASPNAWPAFHGYGISGDVTGQIVYANYGTVADFKAMENLGIDVAGKIVLARYGAIFRGLKVLNAQRRGAIGVLLYSDPIDDGYARGNIYPNGPFRPPSAIQRGSVQFLSLGPGDPSTPFGPSVKGADRLPFDRHFGFPLAGKAPGSLDDPSMFYTVHPDQVAIWEEETGFDRNEYFAAIPSLPISYEAAQPIFEALAGPEVPEDWQGGLPLAYHVGPGPVEVRLAVRTQYSLKTIHNVIATLPGEIEPDRWVMVGNHRDAWTYGAVDPGSGTAATLEACRALGEASKAGWRPRRTLVYASWDAEEYGLVGSTEWADEHRDELDAKGLIMLNVDSAVSGPNLDIDGVPSLRDLMLSAAADVIEPSSGRSLREVWLEEQRSAWAKSVRLNLPDLDANDPEPELPPFSARLKPLGSGSDYTAFVDHLGIPALNVDFGGRYGVYHSIYDDFFWMERFGDPSFTRHTTAAKLYTLILLRASSAEVAPLTFTPYGEALEDELNRLREMVARKTLASDDEPPIRFEGLVELSQAIQDFQEQAAALDEATAALAAREDRPDEDTLSRVNDALMRVERAFLIEGGLPGRPFFRHAIYAPGLTTGYASWPLPGVRQAIEETHQDLMNEQVPILIDRIKAAMTVMSEAEQAARDED
ncbi:M28 family metallopeptidase [Tautonia marina]|uniref:M28 family metallopeptidase n=1 Tax=Tautonia marina TaxID=2653855 RepID=UPI001F2B982B|nr:M28 family metallopeptidase [Tautonia marina]